MKRGQNNVLVGIMAILFCISAVACQSSPEKVHEPSSTSSQPTTAGTDQHTQNQTATSETAGSIPLTSTSSKTVSFTTAGHATSDIESRTTTSHTLSTTSASNPTTWKNTVYSFANPDILSQYNIQGRSALIKNQGISFDWSANTLEFRAYCKGKVSLSMYVDSRLAESGYKNVYFSLYVDGVKQERLAAAVTTNDHTRVEITLADKLSAGQHRFKLVRQTESYLALVTLNELRLTGYLSQPPAKSSLYIEFIGDSVTVGLGNLCTNGEVQPESDYPVNQDATQSWAYFTADALCADYSVLARTGIGVFNGWDSNNKSMADMYPYVSYYRDKTTLWEFKRAPDLIIVNLGTNDMMRGSNTETLKMQMKSFLQQIRKKNPHAKILWVAGGMLSSYWSMAQSAVDDLGGKNNNYYCCRLTAGLNGGGNGHPSAAQQKQLASELFKYLQQNNLVP